MAGIQRVFGSSTGANFAGTGISLTPWTPTVLGSSLSFWYDASLGATLSGGNYAALADGSGNGLTLSATSGAQPHQVANAANSHPAIQCNAAAQPLVASVESPTNLRVMWNTPFTVFLAFVYETEDTSRNGGNHLFFGDMSNATGWYVSCTPIAGGVKLILSLQSVNGGNAAVAYGSTNMVNGTTYVVEASYDGSNTAAGLKIAINGVPETMTVAADTLAGNSLNGGANRLTIFNTNAALWPNSQFMAAFGSVAAALPGGTASGAALTSSQVITSTEYLTQRFA